jgi:protein involved in polysaccharide export with SLBB domain
MVRYSIIFLILLLGSVSAQTKDYEIGSATTGQYRTQGGYYDYADPASVNIKVSVWGYVRYPGRYVIPLNTTVMDLISFAGGPTVDSDLEDVRLYRVDDDSLHEIIRLNYNDLLWEDSLRSNKTVIPDLQAGDVLILPGQPRYFFRENLSMYLSVFSALISLTILLLNVFKN